MLFPKRAPGGDGLLQKLRDAVEIVAIILAGCWAIYVFVYENRIKPANAFPEITIAAQLVREGHRGAFEIVDVRTQIKNVGTVPVQYLGFAETLRGSAFLPGAPHASHESSDDADWTPFYSLSRSVVIFQHAFVTSSGSATEKRVLFLGIGQEYDSNTIVYVPIAYSHITLYASGAYWRETTAMLSTTMTITRDGAPQFNVPSAQVPTYNSRIAEADVSGD
jgi:hypothetical protein